MWPTFPQIFINGSFVGGVDVVCDLISEGEFEEMIPDACRPLPPKEALTEFLKANRLVCFLKGTGVS
jgi:glutaredoxin-related protein